MMKLFSLCLVLCLLGICQADCYGEEGTTLTISCNFFLMGSDRNFSNVVWTADTASNPQNNNSAVVSECDTGNICNDRYGPAIRAVITNNNSSTLMITNLTRVNTPFNVQTFWKCQFFPKPNWYTRCVSYNFTIYAKPQSAKCIYQSVNMTSNQVTCRMDRIYPAGSCSPYISRDNVSFTRYNASIFNITTTPLPGTPSYYTTICQIQIDQFYIGANYFKVQMTSYADGYSLWSEVFLLPYVEVPGTTTQGTATQITPTPVVETPNSKASDSGPAIGLGITTALFGIVAITLAVLMLCYWLRHRKESSSQNVRKPATTEVPESYNRVGGPQLNQGTDSDNNYYEEVQRQNVNSAGTNTEERKPPKHEVGQYANTAKTHKVHKQQEQHEPGQYENPVGSDVGHKQHEPGPYANSPQNNHSGISPRGKRPKETAGPYMNYTALQKGGAS